jgi:hypothetical protein
VAGSRARPRSPLVALAAREVRVREARTGDHVKVVLEMVVLGAVALMGAMGAWSDEGAVDLGSAQVELRHGATAQEGRLVATTPAAMGYYELLHTTEALTLEPGARFRVTFRYRLEAAADGVEPYMLFRARAAVGTFDTPITYIDPHGEVAEYTAELPLRDDMYLILGVHGGGSFEVWDLAIDPLPGGLRRVHPEEDTSPVTNPGKGWAIHFYDNGVPSYGQRINIERPFEFPGAGMAYFRLAWAYLEPEEGVYDWSLIDPWFDYFVSQGLQVGFRITCAETHDLAYATPEWVREAGAVFYQIREVEEPHFEPDYGDPIFLEKLDGFLAAFARKYDGDPNVAWIDVGTIGVWGEGHPGYSAQGPVSQEVYQRHIDLHHKHFRETRLIANDDFGEPVALYARGLGEGLRDDSVCVYEDPYYRSTHLMERFWRHAPTVIETGHWEWALHEGTWDADAVRQCVEDYHASWVSVHAFPDDFLAAEEDLVRDLAGRMGYWLFLTEAVIPRALRPGDGFALRLRWENRGVAPLYRNYAVAFALLDEAGDPVWSAGDDRCDLRQIGPGEGLETVHSYRLPEYLAPGSYRLCVALSPSVEPIAPAIALPLAGRTDGRWHPLGELTLVANRE